MYGCAYSSSKSGKCGIIGEKLPTSAAALIGRPTETLTYIIIMKKNFFFCSFEIDFYRGLIKKKKKLMKIKGVELLGGVIDTLLTYLSLRGTRSCLLYIVTHFISLLFRSGFCRRCKIHLATI